MDLRRHLVKRLSGFSLALLFMGCVLVGLSLREDVADELRASGRTVELLLAVEEARERGSGRLERLIAEGELRHIAVGLERSGGGQAFSAETPGFLGWFAELLPAARFEEQRIPVGRDTLVIRAEPRSEIREILSDGGRLLATLALCSLATLWAAWYAAHRALRPVRELERGLERLAQGAPHAGLPDFELDEFRRIAGAIDRLAASLAAAREAERSLARRLIDVQESERREMARELHDEFGQSLTAIGAAAAFVERHAATAAPQALSDCARDVRTEAARVSRHVRGLLKELRPHGLAGLGVVDALAELAGNWRQRAPGVTLDLALPASLSRMGEAAALALYRALQEALTNVLRHSGARRVAVSVADGQGGVWLVVSDDGCGKAGKIRPGGGLLGMRERAEMAGGRLAIEDAPGGGLRLGLWLPVEHDGEGDDDPDPAGR